MRLILQLAIKARRNFPLCRWAESQTNVGVVELRKEVCPRKVVNSAYPAFFALYTLYNHLL